MIEPFAEPPVHEPPLKRFSRLQTRIGLAVGALIICLALALAGVLAGTAEKEILALNAANLETLSEQMARELADGMNQFLEVIMTESQRDRFRNPTVTVAQMRDALNEFKQLNPDFSYVSVIDASSARVLAATGGIFENGSAAGRPVFEEGKKGPFLGDVHDAVRLAELITPRVSGEPLRFLDAAAPITDPSGRVVRVIAGHIGWQWTRRVVEQSFGPLRDRHGIEIFLLDTENKVVLSGSADVPVGTPLESIERLGLEKTKKIAWPDNKEYLTFVAPTQPRGRFSGFGWKVVAREPYSEAFLPIQQLRIGFGIGALLMGLIASALAWFLAARIVRPVRMLAEAASRADPLTMDELALSSGIGEVSVVQRAMHRMSQSAKRSDDASALSERQFSVLAAALKEVVWQADQEGHLEYVNKDWIRALKPHGAFALDDLADLLPFAEDRNRFLLAWHAALRHGESMRVRARFHNQDVGGERWYEIVAEAVKDNEGKVTRWVGTIFDVHDVVSLADRTNQALIEERAARSEAERLARMRDEFLAIASHELRSPLSAITGWSDILMRRGSADPVMVQAAEVIRRNATLQAALINDLLDMSAVIAGKIVIHRAPIDISELAQDVVLSHLHAAQVKGVALRSNDAEPIFVEADRHRMTQVLSNLVANAIKFTEPGGRIDIETDSVDGQAVVTVRDTGRGIAPAFLPFVFDRLRQEDASVTRRAGGLGLGLAIARGLVELHEGTIGAMSEGPGQGSTFTVKIPLVYGVAEAPVIERPDESKSIDLSGARILLVDDEKDARDVAQVALSSLGAQVKLAASAAEALLSLQEEIFDVLVSDVGMPEMDGLTLMRAVRRLPKKHNGAIAAVALTAFALESDRQAGQAAGFNCYVTKPISLRRLAEGIELARETVASEN